MKKKREIDGHGILTVSSPLRQSVDLCYYVRNQLCLFLFFPDPLSMQMAILPGVSACPLHGIRIQTLIAIQQQAGSDWRQGRCRCGVLWGRGMAAASSSSITE